MIEISNSSIWEIPALKVQHLKVELYVPDEDCDTVSPAEVLTAITGLVVDLNTQYFPVIETKPKKAPAKKRAVKK